MGRKLNVIDLFAGCGGLSEGFEKSRYYKSLAFVEWENSPCKTLIKRLETKWHYKNAQEIVLRFDIQKTDELIRGWSEDPMFGSHHGLRSIVGKKKVDLIIGGPPCQAYSIAGRVRDEHGMKYDYRNYLFESYLRVVTAFEPTLFVFENVEGILTAKPGDRTIIDRITAAFNDAGYYIIEDLRKYALVNAADYGVPQNRKRVIIIGIKKDKVNFKPEEALTDFYENILPSYKVFRKKTVKDAISDLPPIMPLLSDSSGINERVSHQVNGSQIANHIPRFHSTRDQKIFAELASDKLTGSKQYPDTQSLITLYKNITGRDSNFHKYYVLDMQEPSNTIPAHLFKDGLRHIHPDPLQARSITPREAARLQSFDDDFEFCGSMGDQYKMIGNAVPPVLAEKIALAIKEFTEKYFSYVVHRESGGNHP